MHQKSAQNAKQVRSGSHVRLDVPIDEIAVGRYVLNLAAIQKKIHSTPTETPTPSAIAYSAYGNSDGSVSYASVVANGISTDTTVKLPSTASPARRQRHSG